METFSDGVFAIAATLLVLEIAVDAHTTHLAHDLVHLWPSYLAYVTSFLTLGVVWINHHYTVGLLDRVDRTFLFINNLLLLVIAFSPFPTRVVAEHLTGSQSRAAAVFYTGTFTLMAVMHQVYWQYARRGRRLIAEGVPDSALRAVDLAYAPGVLLYGATVVVAIFSPLAAVLVTFAIAAFYVPSAAIFDR
jgi:uncharacterized membrane protein